MEMPDPVTLVFALATKSHYRDILYSKNEVFCGPDEISRLKDGRPITLNTPRNSFDVDVVLKQLPSELKPELIVVKLDATQAIKPMGLSKIDCPKVLILGAPHQFSRPLTHLFEYQESERFDIIVSDHDRHHLHWFKRMGYPRVHWLPGLNCNLRQRPIEKPEVNRAIFVGQTGKFHPYRSSLFKSLERRGLPVDIRAAEPEDAANLYASHAISLNGSLNGDLNLRVFEVIGSGGFLMTDKLSSDAGLEYLFEDGKELVLYSNLEDLAEKIGYYLENTDEAMTIRTAGQKRLLEEHHPDLKRKQFMDLVFESREAPPFVLSDPRYQKLIQMPQPTLKEEVAIYEFLQELHIKARKLIVYSRGRPLAFAEDLPRLEYRDLDACSEDYDTSLPKTLVEERFLAIDQGGPEDWRSAIERFVGNYIILCRNLDSEAVFSELLAEFDFSAIEDRPGLYIQNPSLYQAARYVEIGANIAAREIISHVDLDNIQPELLLNAAQIAGACEDYISCQRALETCIETDRSNQELYLVLADIHKVSGDEENEFLTLKEATRLLGEIPEERLQRIGDLKESSQCKRPRIRRYLETTELGASPSLFSKPKRILVYTNLFPPQELGGYGRKMWEFAYELSLRGHEIKVLAGDAPYLWKEPKGEEAALEPKVSRVLEMYGKWADGSISITTDQAGILKAMRENALLTIKTVEEFEPDFCLMGNLDLIGHLTIEQLTSRSIPVVQCMGNALPGWPAEFKPDYDFYAAGPASHYLIGAMRESGFAFDRQEVLYPGARIDRFYREFLPRTDIPRIAFAGLLMAYKGAHTMIDALCLLKEGGLEFRATIAGDSTDRAYVDGLKIRVKEAGLNDWVSFPGFLDRVQLNELFCRSNILAFPSVFQEPFGISQIEAMASGMVVITSGRGGSREIVRDEVDGLLFEGENAVDFAKKVASLVADPQRWRQLAIAGRERAIEFGIPRTVDKIESLFETMGKTD